MDLFATLFGADGAGYTPGQYMLALPAAAAGPIEASHAPGAHFVVSPTPMIDGRIAVRADLLVDARPGGIHHAGFAAMLAAPGVSDLIAQIEVLTTAQFQALRVPETPE